MRCDQELCPVWDGDSCPCDTFGLDRDDLPTSGVYAVEYLNDDHYGCGGPCDTSENRE